MKKLFILVFFVLLVCLIVNSSMTLADGKNKVRIDASVEKSLEEDGKAEVIVVMKDLPGRNNEKQKEFIRQNVVSSIGKEKVEQEFSSFNGFSASLTEKELDKLSGNSNVAAIYTNHEVHLFLQDSVPLINATKIWPVQSNGINLTGSGQTICIIDTGINYSHSSLGGCNIVNSSLNGTESNLSVPIQSSHNYTNNYDYTWEINGSGFSKIAVHFVNISTESHYDYVEILDSNRSIVAVYSGVHTDLWSPSINGDKLYIRFVTDANLVNYGFYADKIINGTTNTTYSWSSCSKVIGGWDVYNGDPNPADDHGHGTHVAGIAAANGSIMGVAPGANLIAIKVFPAVGDATDADIIKGIEWCVNKSSEFNISVISMSLGGDIQYNSYCDVNESFMSAAINSAAVKNISVVVATGNNGWTNGISSPACIQNATPVGSVSKSDSISGYNRGSIVQLLAPGESINSTIVSGGYSGNTWSGTSMATPHVAGAIAIMNQYLKSIGKTKTPNQIESIFNSTGKQISDSLSNLTFSRIDVYAAVTTLDIITPYLISVNATSITSSSAVISVNSSEFASSRIDYGTSVSLGSVSSNLSFLEFETVQLSSLASSTLYYYNITICDQANNCAVNGTYNFTTDAAPASSPSGGGGGGGSKISVFVPGETQVTVGYSNELKKDDKIKFTDSNSNTQHSLVVNSLSSKSVEITISSEPIKLTLLIGEERKLSLNNSEYYDFYVKLNGIANNKANMTIKLIHEKIEIPDKDYNKSASNKTILDYNLSINGNAVSDTLNSRYEQKIYIGVIVIIFILTVLAYLLARKKSNKKLRKKKL